MDTLLYRGDFKANSGGIPIQIQGEEELAQQIMIRLSVPLGSFEPNPNLGSLLHTLPRSESAQNTARAYRYIESALVDMNQIAIEEVSCKYSHTTDRLEIAFKTVHQQSIINMEVSV